MPVPSPFHPRTSVACESLRWKDWSGYHAVCRYGSCHEPEYLAFRHAAGALDASPLVKLEVRGPDAGRFLSRMLVRDVAGLAQGRVVYTCWTDDEGKTLDDGTVTRLEEDVYRLTSALPSWAWFARNARGYRVEVLDVTERIAAIALQGPNAAAVLRDASDVDVGSLRFFRAARGRVAGRDALVTRTGYTGDLGYEIWVETGDALALWDGLFDAGRPHGLAPCGLDALDVTRIEAGFVLLGVDYFSARTCAIEAQKASPFEIGLGWTVQLDREPFVGRDALARESAEGSRRALVGLEIDWEELERLYEAWKLPPALPTDVWRTPVPVRRGRRQVGHASSGVWSPTLKRNLALATVRRPWDEVGTELSIELTVEFERRPVAARVVERPFFDPERKRALPSLDG